MTTTNSNAATIADLEQQFIDLFFLQSYQEIEAQLPEHLQAKPDWLNGWKILSDTLLIQGKDASHAASQALRLNHNDAQEHCYYGLVLKRQGDLLGAAEAFKQALTISPNNVAALNNLGIVEKDAGNLTQGLVAFEQALKLMPDYAECHSNLLFALSHSQTNPKTLFKAHQRFQKQFEAPFVKQWPMHRKANAPDRVLKVGFVSADFREHSIAYCFEPLLKALHQDATLHLTAYYNQTIVDDCTGRLQQGFDQWHAVSDWSDDKLIAQIKQDEIDLLVDLSGHTADNRLTVFAKKPAPIQLSWFGYLATTGLKSMDYYLCDAYLAPPKLLDAYFTEKLVQLPVNALFEPDAQSPEVNALPALSNGYLTFGSFHRASKISDVSIKRWATLLNALPTARLMVGAMQGQAQVDAISQKLQVNGVALERVAFVLRTDMTEYLTLHHQVDVCLDTYPSSGITPALHAAWMGVPTLCESTQTLTGRGALALMSHLDQANMIGQDWEALIAQAVKLATALPQLADTRVQLRTQMRQSALMNAPLQAQALSQAMRLMWQRWLKRKHSIPFKVEITT